MTPGNARCTVENNHADACGGGFPMTSDSLLSTRQLRLDVVQGAARHTIVDGVDLSVSRGEMVAIVGESGSGKSLFGLSLLGLTQSPVVQAAGDIQFGDRSLGSMREEERRALRGGRAAFIFQDPMSALNPVMTIGAQIEECLEAHQPRLDRRARRTRATALLEQVRVPAAEARMRAYPHELSGGLRQRVLIAMALANDPELIIADEPTTALDVTVQAQIMAVLRRIRQAGTAIVFITHDMGLVAENADRVVVFYAGRVVESGPVADILMRPQHPYTRALLASHPQGASRNELPSIEGNPPDFRNLPSGCPFHPRCAERVEACDNIRPIPVHVAARQTVACHLYPAQQVPR